MAAINDSIVSSRTITPSDTVDVMASRQLLVRASVAGDVKVQLAADTPLVFAVVVGDNYFPFAAKRVFSTGTTATATYFFLN